MITDEEWQSIADNQTSAQFYSKCVTQGKFRIQLYKDFIRATDHIDNVNTWNTEKMRPITGTSITIVSAPTYANNSAGALKQASHSINKTATANATTYWSDNETLKFNSALLGDNFNGTETQPKHVCLLMCVYASDMD